jgi:heme/copper-type cytochrome/quinol oxidase subunit 2
LRLFDKLLIIENFFSTDVFETRQLKGTICVSLFIYAVEPSKANDGKDSHFNWRLVVGVLVAAIVVIVFALIVRFVYKKKRQAKEPQDSKGLVIDSLLMLPL